jgi:3-oxoacyl-[acyl-carrier protein] reductase
VDLNDARALVTSSSRNLGAEIARSLAGAGATVAITYHGSAGAAEELAEELRQRHQRDHIAVYADTETVEGVTELMDTVEERLGGVEILVNNSGPFSAVPFLDLPVHEFDRIWNANVTAAYLAVQRAARR